MPARIAYASKNRIRHYSAFIFFYTRTNTRRPPDRFQQQKAKAIAALPPPHLRLQLKSAASSVVPTARPTHFHAAKTAEKIPDRQTAEHSREYPLVTSTNTSYRCQHSMGIKLWQLEKKPCQESGSSEISRDRASIRSQGQQLPIGRCTSKQMHSLLSKKNSKTPKTVTIRGSKVSLTKSQHSGCQDRHQQNLNQAILQYKMAAQQNQYQLAGVDADERLSPASEVVQPASASGVGGSAAWEFLRSLSSVWPEWIIAGFILVGKPVGNGSNAGMCNPGSAPIGPSLHSSEDSTTRLFGRGSEASAAGVVSVP
ncbi:hypothetical protein Nepgr_009367 [Nepenthes gracilis]|uniref:Uncharacterized protein n=1 Tax=Nepenthes gracilis TaxID=150966 RepID=A0AAD3XK35_NEPGR|nr:hypothetical protein Nepgr_009367 [Nepenthes gracilis]